MQAAIIDGFTPEGQGDGSPDLEEHDNRTVPLSLKQISHVMIIIFYQHDNRNVPCILIRNPHI